MQFREATINDIPALHVIRMAVKENALNNPLLVTEPDYIPFLTTRGKGWLCEIAGNAVGFAIVDVEEKNIWALFVQPGFDQQGIGRQLQQHMLNWYFTICKDPLWLCTAHHTRAQNFYTKTGWQPAGNTSQGEAKFVMRYQDYVAAFSQQ